MKTKNRFPDATGRRPPKGHHETKILTELFFLSMICNELALFEMLPSCEEGGTCGTLARATAWLLNRLSSFTITKNCWPIKGEHHCPIRTSPQFGWKPGALISHLPTCTTQLPVLIPNSLSRVPSGGRWACSVAGRPHPSPTNPKMGARLRFRAGASVVVVSGRRRFDREFPVAQCTALHPR